MVGGAPMPTVLWCEARGRGPEMVLLHPGGSDSRALDPLIAELESAYTCLAPDQRGHGRTSDVAGPLTFEAMAADTIRFLEDHTEAPVHLFGYSDGAIVALFVALARPDLVRSLVFSSGVFHHSGWLPGVLDEEPPQFMADSYAQVSPDGPAHWATMVGKMHEMHLHQPALTEENIRSLTVPTLVLIGDDDEIQFEHALALYRVLPDGEFAVVPRATHGVVVEKPALVATLIREFHSVGKTDGFAPIRRA